MIIGLEVIRPYVTPLCPLYTLDTEKRFVILKLSRYTAVISTHPVSSVNPVTVYCLLEESQAPVKVSDLATVYVHCPVTSSDPYITVGAVMISFGKVL